MNEPSEKMLRQDRIAAVSEAAAIIELHQRDQGITEKEIAAKLGLTEYGVRWLLADRGFEPRYISPQERRRRELKDMRQRVVPLYRSGMSLREIAEQFGVSQETVRNVLKRRGVKRRAIGKWHKADAAANCG